MSVQALAMPVFTSDLVLLTLNRMGLHTPSTEDDLIVCPLAYEAGNELSLVIMCIGEPGWFGRVRCQRYTESLSCFAVEALVRFLFQFRQQRCGAASDVFEWSVS
jgi:hypothetical protein